MQFFPAFLLVLALTISTTATPAHATEHRKLVNVSVPITQPSGDETYYVGSTQLCCWLTDNIPASAANQTSSLIISHYFAGSNSEHLNYHRPLARDFLLNDGCVNYVVPDVLAGDSYLLVLLGDSDNKSGLFTIQPDPNSP